MYALIIKLLLIIKLGGTIILLYILGILSLNKASRVKSLASSASSRILSRWQCYVNAPAVLEVLVMPVVLVLVMPVVVAELR